jgi:radical SAM protein with 4Fe4S-binding SPASM domain
MVEGAVNFTLYDMLRGNFYKFSMEGSIEELRRCLLEEGLIFETGGIVPNKIMNVNIRNVQETIHIRELQIRLNGRGEDNCRDKVKKKINKQYMTRETLDKLKPGFEFTPVDKIRIEAEDKEWDKIEQIINGISCNKIQLNIDGLTRGELKNLEEKCQIRGITLEPGKRKDLQKYKLEIFNFFYSKHFNPCLGHQVAIDTNGEIKACLWLDDIIGNIHGDNPKDLIIAGKFDKYWEIAMEKIETCKDCEMRFTCDDCRVLTLKKTGNLYAKPGHCHYDPYTGE